MNRYLPCAGLLALTLSLPSGALAQSADAQVSAVFSSYEQVRAALAEDNARAAINAARTLHRQASSLASAEGATGARMREAAQAARRISQGSANNISGIRADFGALSRALVTLLGERPQLAGGRHVFECPMARGYGRWIQPTDDMANPYMGSRMLSCGRRIE